MRSCFATTCCTDPAFEEAHADASCCDYFKTLCAKNEATSWNMMQNAIRDGVWAFFSDKDLNLQLKPTTRVFSGDSQWAGQETYSVAAMCAVSLIGAAVYSRYGINRPFPTMDMSAIILAGGGAVYTWVRGQTLGQSIFQNLGYSAAESGYLSSIFAGLAEAPTQFILFKFIKLMADSTEYSKFRQDPKSYLCDFFAAGGLSVTVGVIPGAVWQLVYNALSLANANALLAAFAVMTAVLVCNYGYSKFVEKVLESDCYKDCCFDLCGREKDFSAQKEVTHDACCVSLYRFFTSPCRGEAAVVTETRLADPLLNNAPTSAAMDDNTSSLETRQSVASDGGEALDADRENYSGIHTSGLAH